MANRKTKPAEATTEPLDHMPPAVREELGKQMQALQMSHEQADEVFGDGLPFDEERIGAVCNAQIGIVEMAGLTLGKYLCWVKARGGHGNFIRFVETRTRISPRSAQVFMGLARALLTQNGEPIPLLRYMQENGHQISQSKLVELATQHPDELRKLGEGEEVNGITRDDIGLLTVRELREKLKAAEKQLDDKDSKLAQLQEEQEASDREIRKLKRGGREVLNESYAEELAIIDTSGAEILDAQTKLAAKLADLIEDLTALEVPAHQEDIAKATSARTLYQGTLAAKQQLLALVQRMEESFGAYINTVPVEE